MGVDARTYIPNLDINELYSFVSTLYDDAKLEDVDIYEGEMWWIYFKNRMLTIHLMDTDLKKAQKSADANGWDLEDTDQWLSITQDGLPKNTHGLLLQLNSDAEGIMVIKIITLMYGGWFKPNDTVSGPYQKFGKDWHFIIEDLFNE